LLRPFYCACILFGFKYVVLLSYLYYSVIYFTVSHVNAHKAKNVANRGQKLIEDMEEVTEVCRKPNRARYICKK